MQVFGLPRQIIRNGLSALRLLDAKTPDIEAARSGDPVARWRRAMADGLTAERGAKAVGGGALEPLSLGEGGHAEKSATPPRPAQDMDARPAGRRSSGCARTFRCGGEPSSGRSCAPKAFAVSDARECQEFCAWGHNRADGGRVWRSRRTRWTIFWRAATRRLCFRRTGYSMS